MKVLIKIERKIYTKIVQPIKSKIMPIYFKLIKTNKSGINIKDKRNTRIIISLTSIPSRIDKLYLTIETLLRQTLKPDMIILYLGENMKNKELPKEIAEQRDRGLTIKYREDKKLKPHTKYFYSMQEYPNDIIVTVDDDIYYNRNLVKKLIKSYERYPKCVSAMRCHEMMLKRGSLESYNNWKWEIDGKKSKEPSHLYLATGVGGVLYPPNILPRETFEIEKIEKLALNADDIWLKAMELKDNIKVVRATSKFYGLCEVNDTQSVTLCEDNVINKQNDVIIKRVFEYYNLNTSFLI